MEIDPAANSESNQFLKQMGVENSEGASSFMKEIMSSMPGIDEATSFGEVIKSLD